MSFPACSAVLAVLLLAGVCGPSFAAGDDPYDAAATAAVDDLVARHGATERPRIERGLRQVRRAWRAEDGGPEALRALAVEQFVPAGEPLDRLFARLEDALERQDGYLVSLTRDWRRGVDLEIGPQLPVDALLAGYDHFAHVSDDAYRSRLAFVVLLNFPVTTLPERLRDGGAWSRRQWAEARLADRYATRIPAAPLQAFTLAMAASDNYVSAYNIRAHNLLTKDGRRLFPPGLRLISHWNLRDELKAAYADEDGLPRQKLLALVMEKIVRQEIPRAAIDDPKVDWTPETGAVAWSTSADAKAAGVKDAPAGAPSAAREPDERYRLWLDVFRTARAIDPYTPDHPTQIARAFDANREIPEADVRALLEAVLAAPEGTEVARLIAKRLGRPLEPFDIWYAGFKPRARFKESDLDARTKARYPTPDAFAADLPRIFGALGFSAERAKDLAARIVVDPSRGAGHAYGAARRDDAAHLRTRVGAGGMDYKGYNIAVHELGHNAEQVFSTTFIDHTLLSGVPNNAFTEAMAFLFQERDLELLGVAGAAQGGTAQGGAGALDAKALDALETFWATREIAGVALLDIATWHFMYEHPDATPAQLRDAVVGIADDLWNRWYAPLLGGRRDVPLLAIYSHLIEYGIYTPDYPLGHLIAFQVREHFDRIEAQGRTFGAEFERIVKLGRLTPDAWMKAAVGAPLSAEPLVRAARRALDRMAPPPKAK